jgi:hypothetical protein
MALTSLRDAKALRIISGPQGQGALHVHQGEEMFLSETACIYIRLSQRTFDFLWKALFFSSSFHGMPRSYCATSLRLSTKPPQVPGPCDPAHSY